MQGFVCALGIAMIDGGPATFHTTSLSRQCATDQSGLNSGETVPELRSAEVRNSYVSTEDSVLVLGGA